VTTLQELLAIEGVVAAGEFNLDGSLVNFEAEMDISEEMPEMTAQFCATVSLMFNTLAGSFTKMSGRSGHLSRAGRTPGGVDDGYQRRQHPRGVSGDGQGRLQQVVRGPSCRPR
jgi:hypothetical protein